MPFGRATGFSMVKAVLLFLLVMVVISMVGNALSGGALTRAAKKRLRLPRAATCSRCGRYLIGKSGCDCGKKG